MDESMDLSQLEKNILQNNLKLSKAIETKYEKKKERLPAATIRSHFN